MVEIGEQKAWTSTSQLYTKSYVKLNPSFPCCAHCGKELKLDVWYIQINGKTYCSEECVLSEYDRLEPYFKSKKCSV